MRVPRVAIICDLLEEQWPSMDLTADMLLSSLANEYSDSVAATRICPPMRRRFTRANTMSGTLFNAERLFNRFRDYPGLARRIRSEFDLFHIVDHSYGQLLHHLPPERTVITCHDLNTFQSLLETQGQRRSRLFKLMTRYILDGFRKAAMVMAVSEATRSQLLAHGLVPPGRIAVVQHCPHPAYSPEPSAAADEVAARWLGNRCEHGLDILHVGSAVARKRIDVLLQVLARLRTESARLRLVRVGGAFTKEQENFIAREKLGDAIVVLPYVEREVLAAVYRRAALVLQPSEEEGFGLPLIEAMACGTPVVASDIAALREVGGEAVVYCPVADVRAWTQAVSELLDERNRQPLRRVEREARLLARAAEFNQSAYAGRVMAVYREVLKAQNKSSGIV